MLVSFSIGDDVVDSGSSFFEIVIGRGVASIVEVSIGVFDIS